MPQEIEQYLKKYPEEIVMLFSKIRDVIYSIESIIIEEKMWAKLPSYYYKEKFIRIIPFKDHINIEAEGLVRHINDFNGCKFTPKGMLQIRTNQVIDCERLNKVFSGNYIIKVNKTDHIFL